MTRRFAPWGFLVVAVAIVAGSVLFAARAQQTTADTNYAEAQVASDMQVAVLQQERGLDGYVVTRQPSELRVYFSGQRQLLVDLVQARKASSDSRAELVLVARQQQLAKRWQASAARELSLAESRQIARADTVDKQSDQLITDFVAANNGYQARLGSTREVERRRAELVPVWLVVGLSVLFGLAGWFYLRRGEKARIAEQAMSATQVRFGEAMQVSESQDEAHAVLARHLESASPGSEVVILNRNNSADRLEATRPLPLNHPLNVPLEESQPRSCLAVRLNRQYERGDASSEVLKCQICGNLKTPSTCQPLLVGGEVIGSVLLAHPDPLSAEDRWRLVESVSQAAPVLANLRNLALAENRAATDALTGLPNRRAVDDTLKRMLAQATRADSHFSIVLLDLDHFKKINDTHGHERGDEVLAAFGALVSTELRASDLAGRTGGEEFVLLLPDTDRDGAVQLAENVRQALRGLRIKGIDQAITASLGVASFPDDAADVQTLLRIADRALYSAKRQGRDRVATAADSPTPPPLMGTVTARESPAAA